MDTNSIYDYILQFPPDIQEVLTELRRVIKEAAPEAKEKISWGMPTFVLEGNLVHFAAYKKHIGFYPGDSGIEAFKKDIEKYKSSKGAVQFPIGEPMPYELISRIVKYRAVENKKLAEDKLKKKK